MRRECEMEKIEKKTSKIVSILLGNSLDHFDTVLYVLLVPIMANDFFPGHDPTVQIIYMYTVFAGSSFVRPVGSFFFGWLAKLYGPNKALRASLIGVSSSTFLIGVLPDYATIGCFAPIFLIALRAVQGISSAGESAIAKFFIMEGMGDRSARKAAYFYESSTMIGIIVGSFLSMKAVSYSQEVSCDVWRWCFLLGGMLGFLVLCLRAMQEKAAVYRPKKKVSLLLFKKGFNVYKKEIFFSAILYAFSYSTYALSFVFMNTFVPLVTSISYQSMLDWNTKLLLIDLLLIPIVGTLLLKCSPTQVMKISALLLGLLLPIFFFFIKGADIFYIIVVRVAIILLGVAFSTQINFYFSKKVSGENKYIVLSLSNALGTTFLGKSLPAICMFFWYWSNSPIIAIVVPTFLSLVSFFLLSLRKKI